MAAAGQNRETIGRTSFIRVGVRMSDEMGRPGEVTGTIRALHHGVLWIGLGGTVTLILAGMWTLVSRVWAASFTQTLEVLVAAPFLTAWVLSPLLWAARPRREPPSSRGDAVVAAITVGLLVGVAVYAYLPEFFILPLFFDAPPQVESLTLVLVVPGSQWVIVLMAGVVQWARRRGT
jgi:hypothetical protein